MTRRRYYVFSAASGCAWGVLAYFLARSQMHSIVWGGVLVSPLIGVGIGALSRPFASWSRGMRIGASLVSLYVAVTLFGLAAGLYDVSTGVPRKEVEVVLQSVQAVLWGVTFTGYVLFLWPLAFLNHSLLGRASTA